MFETSLQFAFFAQTTTYAFFSEIFCILAIQLEYLFMFIVQKFHIFLKFAIFWFFLFNQEHMSSGSEMPCLQIFSFFIIQHQSYIA
jgi:hypothetical protein